MSLNFCTAMGSAGWLVMLLIWVALIAAVVWAISRLFPARKGTTVPARPPRRKDVEQPLAGSGQR